MKYTSLKYNSLSKSWNISIWTWTFIAAISLSWSATMAWAATAQSAWKTVDLVVDVKNISGHVPLDLEARDFEVRESGQSMTVLGASPQADRDEPWRIVIYLDPAFIHRASLPDMVKALADRAEDLAALGSVEVIRAVSMPRHRLGPTRESDAIRAAVYALPFPAPERQSVAELRQTFMESATGEADLEALHDRARQSARQELALASQRLQVMRHWVAAQPATGAPTAFLWINDGFDLTMTEFYDRATRGRLHGEITHDLEPYGLGQELQDLVGELVASGWTTLPLASSGAPWVDGLKPLRLAAVHTGGLVLSPDRIAEVPSNLGRRWVVTYRIKSADADEAPRRVDVTVHREDLVARGALWRGRPAGLDLPPSTAPSFELGACFDEQHPSSLGLGAPFR